MTSESSQKFQGRVSAAEAIENGREAKAFARKQVLLDEASWLASVRPSDFAFIAYSTSWQGFVQDPKLMRVSFQDHLVHRGDGVFEAIKVVQGKLYLWKAHWQRLERSAEFLGLKLPYSESQVLALCERMLEIEKKSEGLFRIFVSRGEGGFGVSPFDCQQSDLHIFLTQLQPPSMEKRQKGVSVMCATIPGKEAPFAQVKSCNYLPNVLMKKQALESGFDYGISLDLEGFVQESSTENLIWIDSQGQLCHPFLNSILAGTTMVRLFELVEGAQLLSVVRGARVKWGELQKMPAVALIGTTLDVLPVSKIGDTTIPVDTRWFEMLEMIRKDQR